VLADVEYRVKSAERKARPSVVPGNSREPMSWAQLARHITSVIGLIFAAGVYLVVRFSVLNL
jgi:hypothetical protein